MIEVTLHPAICSKAKGSRSQPATAGGGSRRAQQGRRVALLVADEDEAKHTSGGSGWLQLLRLHPHCRRMPLALFSSFSQENLHFAAAPASKGRQQWRCATADEGALCLTWKLTSKIQPSCELEKQKHAPRDSDAGIACCELGVSC